MINVVEGEGYQAPRTIEPVCDWPIIMNCAPSTAFEDDVVALAKVSAAEIMNMASAFQFGVCTSTFAPLPPPVCEVGHTDGWGLVDPKVHSQAGAARFRSFYDRGGIGTCSCSGLAANKIVLWHSRVIDIVQVVIDGEVLDPSAYYLDGKTLIRDDGSDWPITQSGRRGAAGSWEITYRHGKPLPQSGQSATGALACEIAMALSDDTECSLPQRTKTYTNHAGLTLGFIDPMEFLVDGMTGLYVPDQWIRRVNPNGLVRRARAFSRKKRRGAKRISNPAWIGGLAPVYTGDVDQTVQIQLFGEAFAAATAVEAHVWVDPDNVTVLDAAFSNVSEGIVTVDLGDASGWLANLVQDPGDVVLYNLQIQVTFGTEESTWPPDTLTVIGQAA